MKKLEFIENGELIDFDKIVIFIHGWKGNKSSFQTVSSLIKIPNTKWMFPQAPYEMNDTSKNYSWSYQNSDGTYEIKQTVDLLDGFLKENVLNKDNHRLYHQ